MQMEMCIKVIGSMIKLMEKAFINILMEPYTQVIGLKTSRKVMELKLGLMEQNMKENINLARKKVILLC
jgi:hypothetical protein